MRSNVVEVFGGPSGLPEPNAACIAALEAWLEMARSGEIIGVALAGLCHDRASRYSVAGMCGGYSMIGAIEVARADLLEIVRDACP